MARLGKEETKKLKEAIQRLRNLYLANGQCTVLDLSATTEPLTPKQRAEIYEHLQLFLDSWIIPELRSLLPIPTDLKCECGRPATHICDCGILCCGDDPCIDNCGGAVYPLDKGIRRGIEPKKSKR